MLLKEVGDPERFGIAALDEKQVVSIKEKPGNPKSNHAVVVCYMYDNKVFGLIRDTRPSARGELEITTVNNLYVKLGWLQDGIVQGRWTDAGV